MAGTRSLRVLYVALLGDVVVTASKFTAAALAGSSSMFSEGVHSLIDTTNQVILLYGYRRANAPPDRQSPFGHGRELYFWSFVVSMLIVAGGAGVATLDGIQHLRFPQPIDSFGLSYVVLAISLVGDGISWVYALKAFHATKGDAGYWAAIRDSKDPALFLVLLEDTASLIGIGVAAVGLILTQISGNALYDALAAVAIGAVLLATGFVLARENKALLIGERADPELVKGLIRLAATESRVAGANGAFTVHLGPEQVFVGLSLEFSDDLRTQDIEASVVDLEKRIKAEYPTVVGLFVKPQTATTFKHRQAKHLGVDVQKEAPLHGLL